MHREHSSNGFTIIELLVTVACMGLLLLLAFPVAGQARNLSGVNVSMSNLHTLGAAHALYAADWKGRQFTNIPDEMAKYGDGPGEAYWGYTSATGEDPPPLLLGWGCSPWGDCGLWAYWMSHGGNHGMTVPINFGEDPAHLRYFGIFRVPNAKPFHDYVGGRFYGETFYAPNDVVPYDLVEWVFDEPEEYFPTEIIMGSGGGSCAWSSYCFSPAAMFHPNVMRAEPDGGWQDPWSILEGLQCPGLYQAMYPNLKTLMLEHHWNQPAPPAQCNPAFDGGTYDGCEPYYFNHGLAAEPAALFYDMSVRLLPNTEVFAADQQLISETGYGLWSRDTPFGEDGYFSDYGYDDLSLSHHILTTNGILGRDTLAGAAVERPRPMHRLSKVKQSNSATPFPVRRIVETMK